MKSNVVDITPPHEPIALARDFVKEAPGCIACLGVLVRKDGSLWYDMSGHQRKDILWALQRMIHQLMSDEE